ncbi:Sulfotransferase domain protein [Gimesia chilikensis]|uniref:Sulfotransferase domain protein n=1 Tax=Gimesia chilikensis TaxID=2605989 RepID=A0A517WJ68_9PLAN|nr:sulfotransferase [Gimesia chilikensis]QDU05297.1 Sulfotransferase domain protein [Gimesia chilikensis]
MTKQSVNKNGSTQGPFCVWSGIDFVNFVKLMRLRPTIRWSGIYRLISSGVLSLSNSCLSGLESLIYSRKVKQTKLESPVFIIGHWRSGTTLLHNLMSMDQQFIYPNMGAMLFPSHFLLTERVLKHVVKHLIPKQRPMDNMPVTWDLPQEDETSIMLLHLMSPYLAIAFSDQPEVYDRFYELDQLTPKEDKVWRDTFRFFMQKLTYRAGGNKRVLLKSPTHTFRIRFLLDMFPDARFVYIHRNPYKVYNSTLHLRKTMFGDNGFAPLDMEKLEEDMSNIYVNHLHVYERDRQIVPEGQLHEVSFEDLTADPVSELKKVYEHLNLTGFEDLEKNMQPYLKDQKSYKKNKYEMDAAQEKKIYERWQKAFEMFGYERLPSDALIKKARVAS